MTDDTHYALFSSVIGCGYVTVDSLKLRRRHCEESWCQMKGIQLILYSDDVQSSYPAKAYCAVLSLHHSLIDPLYVCLSDIFWARVLVFGGPVSDLNTGLTLHHTLPAWFIFTTTALTHKCCVSVLAGTFSLPREMLSCDVQCVFVLLQSMCVLWLLNSWTGLYYSHYSLAWFRPTFIHL